MQQIYTYNKPDFDNTGYNNQGKLFSDIIREWEVEFNKEFTPYFANHLIANSSTMRLFESCFKLVENGDFGMDGQFDFETNMKIDAHNKREITYAIGTEANDDEPLYLVIDNMVSEGKVILKYISDSDGEHNQATESITLKRKIKVW